MLCRNQQMPKQLQVITLGELQSITPRRWALVFIVASVISWIVCSDRREPASKTTFPCVSYSLLTPTMLKDMPQGNKRPKERLLPE